MPTNENKILGLKEKHFLILVFLCALALRVAYTLFIRLYMDQDIINDQLRYNGFALNLLQHGTYKIGCSTYALYSPGYPLLLALVYKIFGYSYVAAGIFNSALCSFIPVFIYLTAKKTIK